MTEPSSELDPEAATIDSRARLIGLVLATLAARAWFMVAFRVDSDEPQHLHVAWAWTQGLVQYRDVFDNHLPLLHLLFAPVMAVAPHSSDVFLFTRAAIAPVAVACAWLLYVFAKTLYGHRVAAVAALSFSVMPVWLSKTVEVRNDTLWMLFWLIAMVLLVRPKKPAYFLAGVACALSFLASIKFAPVFIGHLLAFATQRRAIPPLRDLARFALGAALPVAAVCAAFAAAGALDEMLYATLLFNASTPVHPARRIAGVVIFAFVATALFVKGRRWSHVLLFALWFSSVLLAFWPILTGRDFLPLVAMIAIGVGLRWRRTALIPVIGFFLWSCLETRIWRERDPFRGEFINAAVQTTAQDDYVLDLKGDAVFRRRPIYYIYEDVGRALTERGVLPDEGPERIVATGCCAAIRDSSHLPPRTREFLNRHFIGDGPLRVCGERVQGTTFEIGVPQTYAVIGGGRVTIDGIPYRGPRRLTAGVHTIEADSPAIVVWSRAAERWK